MKVRRILVALLAVVVMGSVLVGCATTNLYPVEFTAQRGYLEAQKAYLNTWESYHKVWMALPDTDPRKAEWVKKYHPVFIAAGEALVKWGEDPTDATLEAIFDKALEDAEDILIELAIKKEGEQ